MHSSREYLLEFSGGFCNETQVDANARAFRHFRIITGTQVARDVGRFTYDLIGTLFISRSPAELEDMVACRDKNPNPFATNRL